MDKQVRNKLRKYKEYCDWIEIYEGNIESNMGMSYEGISAKTNETNSDVENKIIQREKFYEKCEEKKKYVKAVNRVLDKLTKDQRIIIEHKFNFNDRYDDYKPGDVPDKKIYESEEFAHKEAQYYRIRKKAYRKLKVCFDSWHYSDKR